MDFDEQLEVDHFVLTERKCRVCGKTKDLIDGFYPVSYTHLTLPTSDLV